jgi:hypothetical protein
MLIAPNILMAQGILHSSENDSVIADEEKASFSFDGFVRGFCMVGAPEYDFPSAYGEFALQGKLAANKSFLFADIRVREAWHFNQHQTLVELKEAYAGYTTRYADFFIGNQLVNWGRADGFNPTNHVTPSDFFFFSPEPDDQKMPNFMLRAKLRPFRNSSLELIAMPFFKPSGYRYDLFKIGDGVSFQDAVLPETGFKNIIWAARLDFNLPVAGFSFSWYNGWSNLYGFRIQEINLVPAFKLVNQVDFFKKNVVGADLEIPVKSWILRGEMAYSGIHGNTTNPDISYVLGLERDIGGYLYIFQYIGKSVLEYNKLNVPVLTNPSDPMYQMQYALDMVYYEMAQMNRKIFQQQEKTNHALFLTISKSFAYEVLRAEVSGLYNISSKEYVLRTNLKWALSDQVSLHLGANYMAGPEKEIFDYAGKLMNGLFLGITGRF